MRNVAGKNRRDAVQRAVRYGGPRTATSFLGRLKDQAYRTRWRTIYEEMRGADQHRHVGAVTASVHSSGIDRRVRSAGRLVSRQRIHFSA
jgi:hypothetical protein